MRRFFAVIMAVASTCAAGCYGPTTQYRHIHENPYRKGLSINPRFATSCQTTTCDRVIYINGNCLVTNGTNALSEVDVLVGDHLCIYNQSGGELTLKFREAELFGSMVYTVPVDGCVTLTVKPEARNKTYATEFICTGSSGGGHTNPDVKVGGDEGP